MSRISPQLGMRLERFLQGNGEKQLMDWLNIRDPDSHAAFIEQLYRDLREIADTLQTQAHHALDKEEWLRDQIRNMLARQNYDVGSESDYRGHTDLLVKQASCKTNWIGEAKVHRSYDDLEHGMLQLYTRYCVGTEKDNGMVIFVFNANAKLVVTKWQKKIEDEKLCDHQPPIVPVPNHPFDFDSKHIHSSGLDMKTRHMFCYMHYSPQDS